MDLAQKEKMASERKQNPQQQQGQPQPQGQQMREARAIQRVVSQVVTSAGVAIVVAYILEVVTLTWQLTWRPSTCIAWLAAQFKSLFSTLGRAFAWCSSFLAELNWKIWVDAAHNMYIAIRDLAFAWTAFAQGYWERAREYEHAWILVYIGSFLLLLLLWWLANRLGVWQRLKRYRIAERILHIYMPVESGVPFTISTLIVWLVSMIVPVTVLYKFS